MKRTISLKLVLTQEQSEALLETQKYFSDACNQIVLFSVQKRCWNNVALHHHCYSSLRKDLPTLCSQMVCNAIKKVCAAYKVLKIKKSEEVPTMTFKSIGSVHYDKRTYTLFDDTLSLFSVRGRLKCSFRLGDFQKNYHQHGKIKEAELIRKGKRWFFNLELDLPEVFPKFGGVRVAVDVGENNLATTAMPDIPHDLGDEGHAIGSEKPENGEAEREEAVKLKNQLFRAEKYRGTIYGGGKLRNQRDQFLARRTKLQSNGSQSAKQCLKRISGKERRQVKETNHLVSKAIVREAEEIGATCIVMEELTNIRERIKGSKRIRSRLHRWSWKELQDFVAYKARAKGTDVKYVNPAYTSQTCSQCNHQGI